MKMKYIIQFTSILLTSFLMSAFSYAKTNDLTQFESLVGKYVRAYSAITHDPQSYPCPDKLLIQKTGDNIYTVSGSYMGLDRGLFPGKEYTIAELNMDYAEPFQYKRGTYASVSGYRMGATGVIFDFSGNEYIKYFSIRIPMFSIPANNRVESKLNCTFQDQK